MAGARYEARKRKQRREVGRKGGLASAASRQRVWRLWPTPRAAEGGPDFAKLERGKRTGQSVSPSLATAVALESRQRFPTPRTTPRGCKQLGGAETGPLNPTFREWLMGWPIDWTARRPLETDKYREWLRSHGRR